MPNRTFRTIAKSMPAFATPDAAGRWLARQPECRMRLFEMARFSGHIARQGNHWIGRGLAADLEKLNGGRPKQTPDSDILGVIPRRSPCMGIGISALWRALMPVCDISRSALVYRVAQFVKSGQVVRYPNKGRPLYTLKPLGFQERLKQLSEAAQTNRVAGQAEEISFE